MWILTNSKDLLECLGSKSLKYCSNIKTFDFFYSLHYHSPFKLKDRLKLLIQKSFFYQNGRRRYKFLVLCHDQSYFVKHHTDSNSKYTETDITDMLEFLIDNIFVEFGGLIFQQTVGIPVGTNCAPLLVDLFLYSYEAEFIQNLLKDKTKKHLAKSFNFTFRYIDDVLSLNNPHFSECLHLIYPHELEIKDTTETRRSASYLDLLLEINPDGILSLGFMTNEMISVFLLSTSLSWVVTYHLPQLMAYMCLKWYAMPGLVLTM